tara:strand:- start:13 stop:702 length:690 start_codon:yes stop_codon:yes gene_type:complete
MQQKYSGTIFFAANSIGEPQDIPNRALEQLREAELVIFEEDKPARRTLKQARIHRHYLKMNEHCDSEALDATRKTLESGGNVIYMSDQGCPTLADPGQKLAELGFMLNAKIKVIPGPSSITAALSCCPFLNGPFHYCGFLPRKKEPRRKELDKLKQLHCPIVILDAPYRLQNLLADTQEILGNRKATLSLDISGEWEEHLYGSLSQLRENIANLNKKLNFVLVVSESKP